jgi:hypothetical protein
MSVAPPTERAGVRAGAAAVRAFWTGMGVVTILGLGLRALVGPVIRWTSSFDDENQLRVAAALMSGQWMGEWGSQPVPSITLSKGPGYPLFLAAAYQLGVAPRLGAYALYLLGALLLASTLRARLGRTWSVTLYATLAFCPDVMSVSFSRPYRDQLVAALALLAFGGTVSWARVVTGDRAWTRLRWAGAMGLCVIVALALGWLAISRADTVWVVAACGAIAVLLVRVRRSDRRGWVRLAGAAAVVAIGLLGVPAAVAAINGHFYGVSVTDDYSQGAFAEAVELWTSVKAPGGEPFQLVTEPQRAAVYAVSPAARQVQSRLESPTNIWRGQGCGWRPQASGACTEYGAFFGWAIRDAAYDVGYRTASTFQNYFRTLAHEIGSACASQALSCTARSLSPDLPPLTSISGRVVVSGAANLVAGSLLFADNLEQPQAPVPADPATVGLWASTMRDVPGLVTLLDAGQNPQTIVQQSTVDVLKHLYSTAAALALVLVGLALLRGVLWRDELGRIALVAFGAWLANIGIVAVVFAATNRQFDQVIPSYTLAGQAFLLTGLVLSVAASWSHVRARFLSGPLRNQRRVGDAHAGAGEGVRADG